MQLTNKNAVITGAAGILGQSFSKALALAGAKLALIDISPELPEIAKNIEAEFKTKCVAYTCDISNEDEVIKTIALIEKDFDQIHVLHNNAATKSKNTDEFFKPFEDFSLATWKEIMGVNVDGMFLMAKHVGKHMLKNKIKGSIIQTASIYGVVAPDQRIYEGSSYMNRPISSPAVYSVSKAGVIGLTKYLAAYWGAQGIRVNTLTPGGVNSGQNEVFNQKYSARVPLGRMAEAQDLVGALVFLASDQSSYITGQNLIIDGGLSVW